ncbi:DUF2631 domain-containing protein [Corynebacterium sanguinis]|uniref:DUF2631 domain-containing protein n=1 Tax=Corynebacterium sanguinis TaxID=2594913 RepID=UPI0021B19603|nr:DUF2631 domain-containing protein [Corynebacterium sanguinis]MCT1413101.1 DUF2631 domain-containing protein [Corynebacterium sanguinis]MCT1424762.1 DUF2631 domain-containing protein [Corynebacterium sanguinis]MCT1444402.1 DUF2631 domain-containing protein [Corynebacterium sanguinis]MCT1498348.1 DUF2631 domain-containing protein [Corynebacterium sanguinis]MCT1583852.1 DUF2631 domain-containing protein [Corynebacterium sanguinis]
MATHAKEKAPQVYNGVSEADVPSAKFGWSELSSGAIQIAGWISVAFLIGFNFGNHQGHVETIWLVSLAVLIAIGLILFAVRPRLAQVRTVTARNKPIGYQERDWAYDQRTLSGAYADLEDNDLRALNIDPSRVSHLRTLDMPKAEASEQKVVEQRIVAKDTTR